MLLRYVISIEAAFHMHVLRWWREHLLFLVALAFLVLGVYVPFLAPPDDFPVGEIIRVQAGADLNSIASSLREKKVIRSPFAFVLVTHLFSGARSVNAGAYKFEQPLSAITVSLRLARGESGMEPIRITFPEGISVSGMSKLIAVSFLQPFADEFLRAAQPYEGYLFPDTYIFSAGDTPASIIAAMRAVFTRRTAELAELLKKSGHTLDEVVTMASLIEREANQDADRHIVAGILWKRLELGMPLQVDAVFAYIKGVEAHAPDLDDLKIESPYNTYLHKGLPPTPIGNPGLKALRAVLEPVKTSYLFYLTGADGDMYYAKTFTEHQLNKAKYLR